ncbi:MAG TPA: 4Fe-4S dicluster domain-containing protein, partial [Nitrospirae bacterium]|nr:4Fe-4S dicluster domain-containing protein [Nitrospirota bacterium]
MSIVVDKDKCNACETCVSSCPFDAIEMKDDKAFINEYCNECKACLEVCPEGAIKEVKIPEPRAQSTEHRQKLQDYKGVWIFAEQREKKVTAVSHELLGIGRKLADELQTGLSAVLLGADESEAKELVKWGADKVYLCEDPALEKFNDDTYTEVLSKLIKEHKPSIVLSGATPIGRSFIPRVAARLRAGLTAD